jgi:hypothetical protein
MHGRRARINNSLFETLRATRLTMVDDECSHCGFRPVVQIKQLKRTKKAVPEQVPRTQVRRPR